MGKKYTFDSHFTTEHVVYNSARYKSSPPKHNSSCRKDTLEVHLRIQSMGNFLLHIFILYNWEFYSNLRIQVEWPQIFATHNSNCETHIDAPENAKYGERLREVFLCQLVNKIANTIVQKNTDRFNQKTCHHGSYFYPLLCEGKLKNHKYKVCLTYLKGAGK